MRLKGSDSQGLDQCINTKIRSFASQEKVQCLGEALFSNNKLELSPFKAVVISEWGDWEQNPLGNRSWQWRLNWLSFVSYLIAYHKKTSDDFVLDFTRDAIHSWLDRYLNTDENYPFEFIWHDHATALRGEQLAYFLYYVSDNAPDWTQKNQESVSYITHALAVHGEWLEKDSFYSEHTNHGLEQARVLLLLGTVFESDKAKEWQRVATERISNELDFAFTPEGVHVENSPAYHIFVFKVFMGIIKDYDNEILGSLAIKFQKFSEKSLGFITQILRPDGKLPPIGDTEQLPTSDAYKDMFGNTLEYQYFLYANTQGRQGVRPFTINRVYADSGYAIFRDQWPSSTHYQNMFQLTAKVGCSSRYHHQQDEGHINIIAGGEDWLIDSGLYNYINADPVRKYMRGRAGHNIPAISNASYNSNFDHRLTSWRVSGFSEDSARPFVDMKLDVLMPIEHQRRVDFDSKLKVVKVSDTIIASDDSPRNIMLQWHIPSDKEIVIDGSRVVIKSPRGNSVEMIVEGEFVDSISISKGQREDRVFSCISYKANQLEPSQMIRVLFKDKGTLNVTTHFNFYLSDSNSVPVGFGEELVVLPLDSLLQSKQTHSAVSRTLLLGGDDVSEIAKYHKNNEYGHATYLRHTKNCSEQLKKQLDDTSLSAWLDIRELNDVSNSGAEEVVKGLEGIDCIFISKDNGNSIDFTTFLLLIFPKILERISKTCEIWLSDRLTQEQKNLCVSYAQRRGIKIYLVSDA